MKKFIIATAHLSSLSALVVGIAGDKALLIVAGVLVSTMAFALTNLTYNK